MTWTQIPPAPIPTRRQPSRQRDLLPPISPPFSPSPHPTFPVLPRHEWDSLRPDSMSPSSFDSREHRVVIERALQDIRTANARDMYVQRGEWRVICLDSRIVPELGANHQTSYTYSAGRVIHVSYNLSYKVQFHILLCHVYNGRGWSPAYCHVWPRSSKYLVVRSPEGTWQTLSRSRTNVEPDEPLIVYSSTFYDKGEES